MRADDRLQHEAGPKGIPGLRAAMRIERLPCSPRCHLGPGVSNDPDADDGHFDAVRVELRHATDGALRNTALALQAIDTRDHLRAVRKWHGAIVELLEVAKSEVHGWRILPSTRWRSSARGPSS
jgi:hypothetical protein